MKIENTGIHRLSKEEFANNIRSIHPRHDNPTIIAISGFGGSGKSMLASYIADTLEEVSVIPIDDFIIGDRTERSTDWRTFDRNRLRHDVLDVARPGNILRYQRFNSGEWANGESGTEREMQVGKIMVVEGCGVIHPTVMSYFDYSAWIDCPQEKALVSSKQRDSAETRLFGDDDTNALWDEVWGPNDQDYFNRFRPDLLVDVLIEKQF